MLEVNPVQFFLITLLRWFEIGAVLLFVGAASFREMSYLPSIQALNNQAIGKDMLAKADQALKLRLRNMLYILALLQVVSLFYRVSVMNGDLLFALSEANFGAIWAFKLLLIVCLLGFVRSQVTWKGNALIALGSLLCLTQSLSGHAFVANTAHLVLSDWLHFTAVSIWAGGLLPLRDAARRSQQHLKGTELATFLVRLIEVFSIWAIFCVVLIVMTGAFKAMIYLDPVGNLLEVLYGRVLFIKLLIVSIAIGLGGISRFYILPRLQKIKTGETSQLILLEKQFYRVLSVEFIFVALVLMVAAHLTQTALP